MNVADQSLESCQMRKLMRPKTFVSLSIFFSLLTSPQMDVELLKRLYLPQAFRPSTNNQTFHICLFFHFIPRQRNFFHFVPFHWYMNVWTISRCKQTLMININEKLILVEWAWRYCGRSESKLFLTNRVKKRTRRLVWPLSHWLVLFRPKSDQIKKKAISGS